MSPFTLDANEPATILTTMMGTSHYSARLPDASSIRAEFQRLASDPLASSPSLVAFLRFVVEEALAGRSGNVKEYTVAVHALGRSKAFDPASDASVRVAARQLRFKLRDYYARTDVPGDVEITLPKGGYVPVFSMRRCSIAATAQAPGPAAVNDGASASPPTAPRTKSPWLRRILAGLVLSGVIGLGARQLRRQNASYRSPPVIAVLPFENLTGSPTDVVLSDGLSDAITSALARDTSIRVIARTSAWKFRGQGVDVRDVGRQLGATHVVEGSVRRSGTRYRVSVQANSTADGVRVWAEEYELDRVRSFGLFDLVSQSVHFAILNRLSAHPGTLPRSRAPSDPRITEWMLESRYFWSQRTDSGFARAVDLLTRVIRTDSAYAPAWAMLADVYATMEVNNLTPPGRSAQRAYAAAERALALDSTLGEAWAAIGMMRAFHDWLWDAADEAFKQAITLSPSYATGHSWYSNVLLARGDIDAALTHLESARRLDPLSLPIAYGIAQAYYYGRRWDPGLAAVERALALNPDFSWSKLLKGKLLKGAGRTEEARHIFEQLKDSMELALLDTKHSARDVPKLVLKLTDAEKARSQFWIATNFAQIGWKDSAFAWLTRGYIARQADMASILVDPMIDPLKRDPRYERLLQRMSLSGGSRRVN
ncbi:MAG: hypothetical protein MNPFHGCM_01913 [Gemmatimonadaceae bacterium]|nr:hypothetical protein [Gemmatimonadaceae bacterium]